MKPNHKKQKHFRGQAILTVLSIILIYIFFQFPEIKKWNKNNIQIYWNELIVQKDNLDIETRKIQRWGKAYIIAKQIADLMVEHSIDSETLMIPSKSYFKEYGLDFHVPEPSVFYYYTNKKTCWTNNRDTSTIKYFLHCVGEEGGQIAISAIPNEESRKKVLDYFRPYKPTL